MITDLVASLMNQYPSDRPKKVVCQVSRSSDKNLGYSFHIQRSDQLEDAAELQTNPNWLSSISSVVESLVAGSTIHDEWGVEEIITCLSRQESIIIYARNLLHSLFMQFVDSKDKCELLISSLFVKLKINSLHWICLVLAFNSPILKEKLERVPLDELTRRDFSSKKPLLIVAGNDGSAGYRIKSSEKALSKNELLGCLRTILEAVDDVLDGEGNVPVFAGAFESMISSGSAVLHDKKKANDMQKILAQAKVVLDVCSTIPNNFRKYRTILWTPKVKDSFCSLSNLPIIQGSP
jgi:hypothetical protein